jgi:hypothetical protein
LLLSDGRFIVEITWENVLRLVNEHGRVDILDAKGKVRSIGYEIRSAGAVETADSFRFKTIWYRRPEFEEILEKYLGTSK